MKSIFGEVRSKDFTVLKDFTVQGPQVMAGVKGVSESRVEASTASTIAFA